MTAQGIPPEAREQISDITHRILLMLKEQDVAFNVAMCGMYQAMMELSMIAYDIDQETAQAQLLATLQGSKH
jgi:hypothetical protein